MELKDFEKSYVFTTQLDLDDEGNYIILREPTSLEMKTFTNDEDENANILIKLFPECIVEHSFTTDGKPARNKAVGEMLVKSSDRFFEMLETWMNSLPLVQRKSQKSGTLAK